MYHLAHDHTVGKAVICHFNEGEKVGLPVFAFSMRALSDGDCEGQLRNLCYGATQLEEVEVDLDQLDIWVAVSAMEIIRRWTCPEFQLPWKAGLPGVSFDFPG